MNTPDTSAKRTPIKIPSKKLLIIGLVVVAALILALLLHGTGSKVNYTITVNNEKNGQVVTDCNATVDNLASSICQPITLTGKVVLDENSVLMFKSDYRPGDGIALDVPDQQFGSLNTIDKEAALEKAPLSLNKFVNKDGSFSIKLDDAYSEIISNDDKNSSAKEDRSLIIYNVKTNMAVATKDLQVVYKYTDKDKALMATQLVQLNNYEATKPAETQSQTPTATTPKDTQVTDAQVKKLCEARLSEKGMSNPQIAISYFTKEDTDNTYYLRGTVNDGGKTKDVDCWYDPSISAIKYITVDGKES